MLSDLIKQKIKSNLPKPVFEALVLLRQFGTKKFMKKRIPNSKGYIRHVAGKKGIEIGGPSALFRTTLPLYQKVRSLDGVNFSGDTLWEGKIQPGLNFNFISNRKGMQYIADATDLSQIKDRSYDFLLSSNCLEHIANPLKSLLEWKRVVSSNGILILVVPNKESNFDHRRPTTTFAHVLGDFNNDCTEHDLTHLDEILSLHDLEMDPPAGNIESFRSRSLDNYNNRGLHHHIFDLRVIELMLEWADFDIIQSTKTSKDFYALARRRY